MASSIATILNDPRVTPRQTNLNGRTYCVHAGFLLDENSDSDTDYLLGVPTDEPRATIILVNTLPRSEIR